MKKNIVRKKLLEQREKKETEWNSEFRKLVKEKMTIVE